MGLMVGLHLSLPVSYLGPNYGVDVADKKSKVLCCKEQYCKETWNVRSMNEGKLEVVKQEMARVNINILGISKLKCNGISLF